MPNPSWDLTDQDCDNFDLNWAKTEVGTAIISLVTYDSRTCYKFTSPQNGSANYAWVANSTLSPWTECSAEWVFRDDSMSIGGYPKIWFYLRDKYKHSWSIIYYHDTTWTAKPYIFVDAGGFTGFMFRQWVDVSANEWHTLRVVINSSLYMWVFFDGQYLGKVPNLGLISSATPNTIGAQAYGVAVPPTPHPGTGTRELWIDHIRMSTTKLEPDYCGLIKIQGDNINTKYYSEGNEGLLTDANPADKIRYALENRPSGTGIYALPITNIGSVLASKIRVKVPSLGTYTLQKYPTSF